MKMFLCLSHFKLGLTHHKTHRGRITAEGKISSHSPIVGSQSFPTISSVSYPHHILRVYWSKKGILQGSSSLLSSELENLQQREQLSPSWFFHFVEISEHGSAAEHPGSDCRSIKRLLVTTRWGEKLIVLQSHGKQAGSTVCSLSPPSEFNLTFSLPSQISSGAMNSMRFEFLKKSQYNLQVSFMICSFSILCCNPWDIGS